MTDAALDEHGRGLVGSISGSVAAFRLILGLLTPDLLVEHRILPGVGRGNHPMYPYLAQ